MSRPAISASPYDTDACWSAKGDDLFWLGYKAHLTESCDNPPKPKPKPKPGDGRT